MRGWLTRSLGLKLVSILLALLTWTAVVYAGNPPEERTFSAHVPQEAGVLPAHYVLLQSVPDLSIRVLGLRDHLDQFNTDSLQVTANWTLVTQGGSQSIPVTVKSTDPNVELDNPPTSITADLDVRGTRTVRSSVVRPNLTGSVSLGHEVAGISVVPLTVVLSGPTDVLTTLTSISTDPVPLTGIDVNRSFSVKVLVPAGVTADVTTVQVTVTVSGSPTPTPQPSVPATPPSPTP